MFKAKIKIRVIEVCEEDEEITHFFIRNKGALDIIWWEPEMGT